MNYPFEIDKSKFNDFFHSKLVNELHRLIDVSLEEDLDIAGDVTSNSTINESQQGSAIIISKQNGIFAGGFVISEVFKKLDPTVKVKLNATEGSYVDNKQRIAYVSGSIKNILIGERTVLNFISRISGIATLTNSFVERIKKYNINILDTRKTLPGWRYLDKYSVKTGGGLNHRIGLFDMILLKENHLTAAGGISNAVEFCRNYLTEQNLDLKLEVETKNIDEVVEAIEQKVDVIMLDNMSVAQIQEAVNIITLKDSEIKIEISGGVNTDNIDKFFKTGVNFISIGQLTHSVKGFDFSLLISE